MVTDRERELAQYALQIVDMFKRTLHELDYGPGYLEHERIIELRQQLREHTKKIIGLL